MEQSKYDNSISLRDENLDAAEKIAAEYDKVLIEKDKLEEYVTFEKADSGKIEALVEASIKAAKNEVYASENAKLKNIGR